MAWHHPQQLQDFSLSTKDGRRAAGPSCNMALRKASELTPPSAESSNSAFSLAPEMPLRINLGTTSRPGPLPKQCIVRSSCVSATPRASMPRLAQKDTRGFQISRPIFAAFGECQVPSYARKCRHHLRIAVSHAQSSTSCLVRG